MNQYLFTKILPSKCLLKHLLLSALDNLLKIFPWNNPLHGTYTHDTVTNTYNWNDQVLAIILNLANCRVSHKVEHTLKDREHQTSWLSMGKTTDNTHALT